LGEQSVGVNGDGAVASAGSNVGIAFQGVGKAFGDVVALDGVTFEIDRNSRIVRPRQLYDGASVRDYVGIDARS